MIPAHEELTARFTAFADFAAKLKGDEKGEAQSFLDQLFRALGHKSAIEAGATFEFRVAKKPGSSQLELLTGPDAAPAKGGKKFADLLWPSRVLIEMKSRGAKLEKHYDQLFDYWSHIVPHRPPYAILCNFDEFWIYDFNQQLFDPVDKIPLAKLHENRAALGFLLPIAQKPQFDNDRVAVTRKAADVFADVFKKLIARRVPREQAQRFILQLLVALVAQDLGLLPERIVTDLLRDSAERPADSYDLLGGLFAQMASPKKASGGRYEHVQYFNGGLFEHGEAIALKSAEAHALHDAAKHSEWDKVKPEIFGTIFQQSMEDGKDGKSRNERHAFGAHFTSEFDIEKVVTPTITRPWRERILAAGKSLPKLRAVLAALRAFRVLDPACGSGNFLFVAYREVKRLERQLLVALRDAGEKADKLVSAISLENFFGLDVVPFAVELAKVTLMLAKELELREAAKTEESDHLHLPEKPLPLDNLDKQILCADALFTKWPKADAIIGNPPYLGSRYIAKEHGHDYTQRLYARFPGVPKMADFCTHWFRLAHDALPVGGRAGLVGTNTIRQNESREASLDHIVKSGGIITEAVSTQVWSGEAAVHVSIVNWIKENVANAGDCRGVAPAPPRAVPRALAGNEPRADGDDEDSLKPDALPGGHPVSAGAPKPARGGAGATQLQSFRLHTQLGDRVDSPWKIEDLPLIPPTLKSDTDVTGARVLAANERAKKCFTGQNPVNAGFFLTHEEAAQLIKRNAKNRDVIFPYMIGRDLVEDGGPTRCVIDFAKRDLFAAMAYAEPFAWVKERVLPVVLARAEAEKKAQKKEVTRYTRIAERWWQFYDYRPGAVAAVESRARWVALSRTSKRPIFEFVCRDVHADSKLVIFSFPDDYSFGILSSNLHWRWTLARGGTLESRPCYTADTVFDTFPWPQKPGKKAMRAVADAAVALRKLRRTVMTERGWSLRALYRTLDDPGASPLKAAHATLDAAVRTAYGMAATEDPLAFLLSLNAECAAAEKASKPITPPGLPLPPAEHAAYITEDCIPAPKL